MIKVFILTTGDEIIGDYDLRLTSEENYRISNPMYIIGGQDEYGMNAMRLRNVLLLSRERKIIILPEHIIMQYIPSDVMIQYYTKAVEFDEKYGRPEIESQIGGAIVSLEESCKEQDYRMKTLSSLLLKLAGQRKLH